MNNRNKATAMDSVVELSPKIRRGRSTFNLGIKDYTSFNVGDLVPLGGFTEVLPGDTFNVNLKTFVRMTSSSKRPPMDNLHMDVFAFFVPYRFLDVGWVNIQGENSQAWAAPAVSCSQMLIGNGLSIQAGSLLNHLGMPIFTNNNSTSLSFNIYPVYAYFKIINDWFRDENLEDDIAFDNTNGNYGIQSNISKLNNKYVNETGSLFKVAKYHDVYTSALPAPQKSTNPVTVPLGLQAPIKAVNNGSGTFSAIQHFDLVNPDPIAANSTDNPMGWNISAGTGSLGPLYADLQNATSATINQLRLAFQLQKAYELDARSGTRYTEAVEARFGTKNPDLRLGRSELLGHYRFDLNMSEVNSTAGAGATGATVSALKGDSYLNGVGAGSSKTGNEQHICVKSFTEHGLFMILGCVRPDLTYQSSIEKFWRKKDRWDFYEPIFSNIGEMPIMKSELYANSILADSVFGYQEAWYDYRYKMTNQVSGILASDSNQGYDIFHYAQDFGGAPTLGQTFIKQSTAGVDRTLIFDSTAVDNFICNVQGVIKATRVMPLFSTPGLIDHF